MLVFRSKINLFQRSLIVYIFGLFSIVATKAEVNFKPVYNKFLNLEFRLEANSYSSMLEKEQFNFKDLPDRSIFLEKEVIVTSDNVIRAKSSFDENGMPQIEIVLDMDGAQAMAHATKKNIGRRLVVLLVEEITKTSFDEQGKEIKLKETVEQVISSATIQAALGAKFRITGLNSMQASELALQLNLRNSEAQKKQIKRRSG